MADEELIGNAAAAEYLGVSLNAWRPYVARGQAPAPIRREVQGGHALPVWTRAQLDEWRSGRPRGMRKSIRGAGTDRGGASEVTQLIWKVIDANPGITKREIFVKVEHSMPPGWVTRRYRGHASRSTEAGANASVDLGHMRWVVLGAVLNDMVRLRSIARDSRARDARFRTLRPLTYLGDASTVDETGTVAARHLNEAYARRRSDWPSAS